MANAQIQTYLLDLFVYGHPKDTLSQKGWLGLNVNLTETFLFRIYLHITPERFLP